MHFVSQAAGSKPKLIPAIALCAVALLDKGLAGKQQWPQLFAALSWYDPPFDYCGNGAQTFFKQNLIDFPSTTILELAGENLLYRL